MRLLFLPAFVTMALVQGVTFALSLPITVKEKEIQEELILSGPIEPAESQLVKIRWFSLIRKIPVQLGQEVRSGDCLAEVEVKYLEYQGEYLRSREKFLERHVQQTEIDEKWLKSQKFRLQDLASKAIVAQAEVEKFSMKTIDAEIRRLRAQRELKDIRKTIAETKRQMESANYYAPMSGVITDLILNPKQLLGSFVAMPGSKLARIDRPGRYLIKTSAVDTQVAKLNAGQVGEVVLDSTFQKVQAKISLITENTAAKKEGQNIFEVIVSFEKDGPILNRGVMASVRFLMDSPKKVPTIPWNAVHILPSKATVMVKDESRWMEREVTLMLRTPHLVGISSGLQSGDVVNATLW